MEFFDFELLNGVRLRESLARRRARPRLATRVEALDRLQEGGLVRGSLIELSGPRSSGRFAISLAVLAAATSSGEAAAMIDPGDHLDPQQAKHAGADLSRLLWLRPRRVKEALVCAELTLGAGFAVVVLDLAEPLRPAPPPSVWVRLRRSCELQSATLLLVSAEPLAGRAADSFLQTRADGMWRAGGKTPCLLDGMALSLELSERVGARRAGTTLSLPLDSE